MPSNRQSQRQCHRRSQQRCHRIGKASDANGHFLSAMPWTKPSNRQSQQQCHRRSQQRCHRIGNASEANGHFLLAMPARLMAIFSWQCHRIGKASGNANPLSNSTRQCHQQCHRLPISARQWQRINPTWFFAQNSFFIKSSQIRTIERG